MKNFIYFVYICSIIYLSSLNTAFAYATQNVVNNKTDLISTKDYKIIKGDTLWLVSKKVFQNPLKWPKIWKSNSYISDPNLIYPDNNLKIISNNPKKIGYSYLYLPRIDLDAKIGSKRHIGRVSVIVPFLQNDHTLLFTNLIAMMDTNKSAEGNFGLGIRHRYTSHILGLYAFYDRRKTQHSNHINQLTAGFELLTKNYEFRINGYLPESTPIPVPSALLTTSRYTGTHTLLTVSGGNKFEIPLKGFDIEGGMCLPKLEQAQLFIAYYHFRGKGLKNNMNGVRIRGDYKVTSWLSLNAEYSYDSILKSTYFGGISLTWKLKRTKEPNNRLLDKMTQPIVRDIDIVSAVEEKASKVLYEAEVIGDVEGSFNAYIKLIENNDEDTEEEILDDIVLDEIQITRKAVKKASEGNETFAKFINKIIQGDRTPLSLEAKILTVENIIPAVREEVREIIKQEKTKQIVSNIAEQMDLTQEQADELLAEIKANKRRESDSNLSLFAEDVAFQTEEEAADEEYDEKMQLISLMIDSQVENNEEEVDRIIARLSTDDIENINPQTVILEEIVNTREEQDANVPPEVEEDISENINVDENIETEVEIAEIENELSNQVIQNNIENDESSDTTEILDEELSESSEIQEEEIEEHNQVSTETENAPNNIGQQNQVSTVTENVQPTSEIPEIISNIEEQTTVNTETENAPNNIGQQNQVSTVTENVQITTDIPEVVLNVELHTTVNTEPENVPNNVEQNPAPTVTEHAQNTTTIQEEVIELEEQIAPPNNANNTARRHIRDRSISQTVLNEVSNTLSSEKKWKPFKFKPNLSLSKPSDALLNRIEIRINENTYGEGHYELTKPKHYEKIIKYLRFALKRKKPTVALALYRIAMQFERNPDNKHLFAKGHYRNLTSKYYNYFKWDLAGEERVEGERILKMINHLRHSGMYTIVMEGDYELSGKARSDMPRKIIDFGNYTGRLQLDFSEGIERFNSKLEFSFGDVLEQFKVNWIMPKLKIEGTTTVYFYQYSNQVNTEVPLISEHIVRHSINYDETEITCRRNRFRVNEGQYLSFPWFMNSVTKKRNNVMHLNYSNDPNDPHGFKLTYDKNYKE